MIYYDEQLKILSEQISQKRKIENIQKDLENRLEVLSIEAKNLKTELEKEKADVDSLKGLNFKALFYKICGKSEEKINVEQQNLYIAAAKYNNSLIEIAEIEKETFGYSKRLQEIRNCEKQYEILLNKKKDAVKDSGNDNAHLIFESEEKIKALQIQLKELTESIQAGNNAVSICDKILSELQSAEGWGTHDLVGGGAVSHFLKHGHLDTAQDNVVYLKQAIRRFKTEIYDIKLSVDFKLNIDDSLRFADYFFDNIFTDWKVLDKIKCSIQEVKDIRAKIIRILTYVNDIKNKTDKEIMVLTAKIDLLVRETKL